MWVAVRAWEQVRYFCRQDLLRGGVVAYGYGLLHQSAGLEQEEVISVALYEPGSSRNPFYDARKKTFSINL